MLPLHEVTPLVAAELFVGLVAVAAVVALVTRRSAIPYSVALVLVGLAFGALLTDLEVAVDPELLLFVLLPGLVFEAALQIRLSDLRGALRSVIILAAPGVLISAGIVAIALNIATGLELGLAFVVGAAVAATDPAAVIAIFRRLGAPKRLATVVEAESLFNDGTGIVVFAIAISAIGIGFSPAAGLLDFTLAVTVSLAVGIAIGWLASKVVATVDDHLIELTISVVVAYGTYLLAERLGQSGIIATVAAGVVLGNVGRLAGMAARTREALDTVWEFVAYLLTALAFLLVGLAISPGQLVDAAWPIAVGFIATVVGRAVVVYGVLGGAAAILPGRSPLPLRWLHVLFWSGLRGAVATALALSLPADLPQRDLVEGTIYGIVILTLVIQGTSAELVIRRTGVREPGVPAGEDVRP